MLPYDWSYLPEDHAKMSALRDQPTLFVWGMKDVAFRDKGLQRWQQALPNSHTLKLPTVGHYVAYGPMISEELRAGRHGFADAVLSDAADFGIMHSLFRGSTLVCQQASDMHDRS